MTTASEDRLAALALLYIAAVEAFCATDTEPAGLDELWHPIALAERALLALLAPVVAPPCAAHDTNQYDCAARTALVLMPASASAAAFNFPPLGSCIWPLPRPTLCALSRSRLSSPDASVDAARSARARRCATHRRRRAQKSSKSGFHKKRIWNRSKDGWR
jgi:hypothetical protein